MFQQPKNKGGFFKAACLGLALLTTTPALANVTRVSELVDVDPNVWAYKALKELVEKYDVLEGYPDSTFKGNKPASRYEMAQALYEVLQVVDMSSADSRDVAMIGRLSREFDRELAAIRNRVSNLEGRVNALEANNTLGSWTDRIKVSGDVTSVAQTDWSGSSTDQTTWGTRARVGIDAVLVADNKTPGSNIGEGIAHVRVGGGNGGPGTFSFNTSGNNLNDVLFDGSSPVGGGNNSLFTGRVQDSRMDLYLDQAYYTQVFKFNSGLLDATPYPNTFLTVDVGQQDFFNTFHKSLVREDSLDGFINQRILQGHVGGSNGITEGIHVGLNFLGSNRTGGSSAGECGPGMPGSLSYDECGQVKEGLFQAASLDYSFMSLKDQTDAFTTTDTFSNYSHNIAANLLYNLPGDIFDDGLITTGASFTHVDFNNGGVGPAAGFFTTADDDTLGSTFFAKWEQWFGEDRTVGAFMDYSFAANSRSNYLVNGPHAQLLQAGLLLNTTFLPTTWNMNKDQLGFAYSVTDPFNTGRGDPWTISQIPTIAQGGPSPYIDHRPEQILEAYYRKYITENISVTPDLQLVFNGNGHNTAISGLIRATFKLPNWNDGGAFDQFGYRDWSQRIAKFKASHASN